MSHNAHDSVHKVVLILRRPERSFHRCKSASLVIGVIYGFAVIQRYRGKTVHYIVVIAYRAVFVCYAGKHAINGIGVANSIAANRLCNYSVKIVIGVGGNISCVFRGFQDVPRLIINHGRRASRSIYGLYYSACVVVLIAGDIAVCVRYGNKLADRIILVAPYISERVSD